MKLVLLALAILVFSEAENHEADPAFAHAPGGDVAFPPPVKDPAFQIPPNEEFVEKFGLSDTAGVQQEILQQVTASKQKSSKAKQSHKTEKKNDSKTKKKKKNPKQGETKKKRPKTTGNTKKKHAKTKDQKQQNKTKSKEKRKGTAWEMTKTQVVKTKQEYTKAEKRYTALRSKLAKAKSKTEKHILVYQASEIALAMTNISKKFIAYTQEAAKQVRASKSFTRMTALVSTMVKEMNHASSRMKTQIKASAERSRATTHGAPLWHGNKMMGLLQEQAQAATQKGEEIEKKLKKLMISEKSEKKYLKERLAAVRSTAQKRVNVAGEAIAEGIIATGKAFSNSVARDIQGVKKSKKLSQMIQIAMMGPAEMTQLGRALQRKLRADVHKILQKARKTVVSRLKHTMKDTTKLPDADIDSWAAGGKKVKSKKLRSKKGFKAAEAAVKTAKKHDKTKNAKKNSKNVKSALPKLVNRTIKHAKAVVRARKDKATKKLTSATVLANVRQQLLKRLSPRRADAFLSKFERLPPRKVDALLRELGAP